MNKKEEFYKKEANMNKKEANKAVPYRWSKTKTKMILFLFFVVSPSFYRHENKNKNKFIFVQGDR